MNRIAVPALLTLLTGACLAQTTQPAGGDPTARTAVAPSTRPSSAADADRLRVTQHSLTLGDRTLHYTATAGTMAQQDESGTTKADIFFVAYTLDREDGDDSSRPLTFVFNGGPGAASVWLHLGTAGPKRIVLPEDGAVPVPPYSLTTNDATWLDSTDLVFIDPVGTGYSRPAGGEKGEQFYGVQEDIRSVGEFIRLYLTRNARWGSPKFIAGESYGTTRAAGLSEYLLEKHGISLNGIILISAVLDFQTIIAGGGNELPYLLYLPTYTATAWHHGKLSPEMQEDLAGTLKRAESFALDAYASALLKGTALDADTRRAVAATLASLTGLSVEQVLENDLRIDPGRFRAMLLDEKDLIVGRFDSRITGYSADPGAAEPYYDPSLSVFLPVYSATLNHYVRTELEFASDLPYEVLTERVHPWNYGRSGTGYLYVADTLRSTMLKNPHLGLLVVAGQMDLATPYLAGDYTLDHLDLPEPLRANITRRYYPAGHMMYHDSAVRRQLDADVAAFIERALGR